jgi:hypothetical protein
MTCSLYDVNHRRNLKGSRSRTTATAELLRLNLCSMSLAKPTEVKTVSDVELPCFSSTTCYVHARIPPCDTLGHKADQWNVAKPDFICSLMCCTRGDLFIVRLLTEDDQIFAESFWKPEKPMTSVRTTSGWCTTHRNRVREVPVSCAFNLGQL